MSKSTLALVVAMTAVVSQTIMSQPLSHIVTSAQTNSCTHFAQTGRVVCGKFLAFWQKNGGLPIFGYPISNETSGISDLDGEEYTVQYFEKALFELHPENRSPHDVQLAHLGRFKYKTEHPDGNFEGDLLLYPKAKLISVELGYLPTQRITTFRTSDSPQAIFAFYKDDLIPKGWQIAYEKPNALRLYYFTRYTVYIETTPASSRAIEAKLYFIRNLPR